MSAHIEGKSAPTSSTTDGLGDLRAFLAPISGSPGGSKLGYPFGLPVFDLVRSDGHLRQINVSHNRMCAKAIHCDQRVTALLIERGIVLVNERCVGPAVNVIKGPVALSVGAVDEPGQHDLFIHVRQDAHWCTTRRLPLLALRSVLALGSDVGFAQHLGAQLHAVHGQHGRARVLAAPTPALASLPVYGSMSAGLMGMRASGGLPSVH